MFPRKLILIVALMAGISFIVASNSEAAAAAPKPAAPHMSGGGGNKNNNKQSQTDKAAPQHTTISLVSSDSITIQSGKESKTFKITQDTAIELKGSRATVADLKPGMRVSITPGLEPTIAGHITANDPPKEPAPASNDKGKGKK